MKQKSKRYYGMTVSQIGILVGAAVLGLLVVGVIFVSIQMSTAPQAQLTVATEIIPPTQTPVPAVSAMDETPTPTPAAVIATLAPPDGWIAFETQGATLWLPASFVGGDMLVSKQETITKVTRLGKFYKNAINSMKTANKEIALWMVDKTIKQTDIITTVRVQHIISTEDLSLDEYIRNYFNGDVEGTPIAMLLTVNETRKMTILGREARRLTYSTTFVGHSVMGLLYYIKDGPDIWAVSYDLGPKEYVDMLPMVEQSIQTFNLVK